MVATALHLVPGTAIVEATVNGDLAPEPVQPPRGSACKSEQERDAGQSFHPYTAVPPDAAGALTHSPKALSQRPPASAESRTFDSCRIHISAAISAMARAT